MLNVKILSIKLLKNNTQQVFIFASAMSSQHSNMCAAINLKNYYQTSLSNEKGMYGISSLKDEIYSNWESVRFRNIKNLNVSDMTALLVVI
jgi:hypothetical protein